MQKFVRQELINTFNDRENNILYSFNNSAEKIIRLRKFRENLNLNVQKFRMHI